MYVTFMGMAALQSPLETEKKKNREAKRIPNDSSKNGPKMKEE